MAEGMVYATLMTTLLPDWVTFIYPSTFKGDSYKASLNQIYFHFSAREFSFPHFAFNLLKIFTK